MTTNINALYKSFSESIKQNTEALQQAFTMTMQQSTPEANLMYQTYVKAMQQNTEALQQGFAMVMQQPQPEQSVQPTPPVHATDEMIQQMVQEQVEQQMAAMMQAAATVQPASPLPPVTPVVEDVVKEPVRQKKAMGDNTYLLQVRAQKSCDTCPFKTGCNLKPSHIGDNCKVSHIKQAAVEAGDLLIKVEVDTNTMTTAFNVYKNDLFIGVVEQNRENKPFRAQLEKYSNQTVKVSTTLKANPSYSAFTSLYAEIVGVVGQDAPAPTIDKEIKLPEIEVETLELPSVSEEATLDLGEMVMIDLGI